MFKPNALPLTPTSHPSSQIISPDRTQRITLLTSGLIRFETTPTPGKFEDRASTFAINRNVDLPTPTYEVIKRDEGGAAVEIVTDRVYIQWTGAKFGPDSLLVTLRDKGGNNQGWSNVWRYGDPVQYTQKVTNLGGTYRTLDNVDGRCPLDPGILSQYGLAVIDDTGSMLFTEDGWVAPREHVAGSSEEPGANEKATDVYLFAYGVDYREALKAFYTVSGRPPLVPRWSLGNWWSRYYSYSDEEFLALMDSFKADKIPLSVAVLDIGWHPVNIPADFGTGWTGYTWNKELFPDHVAFLKKLKDRELKITLNTHPADGVRSHEGAYKEMCKALGRDPEKGTPIPFECTDKSFFTQYFQKLHHPLEDEGVDFWWLDWQQGPHSQVKSIDPLWMLNHYHFLDSGRRGERRFTFSRYAGPGSHRYPIGFSGDTVVSWESLEFQPEFTATASNIGYGHWSHDIGGHFKGIKDNDLMARWVQSGCFSPFLRLHSSISPFNTREPWAFSESCHDVCRAYMQLRHRLIPYLYSASVEASRSFKSLIEPVYYDYPLVPEAYAYKTQYTFGSQLMVIPVVTPTDKNTGMGKVIGWLPPGKWVDVWGKHGLVYDGDRIVELHRDLEAYPVLAKQGAIIPLDALTKGDLPNGTPIPEALEIILVIGADGAYDLVEDDGKGMDLDSVKLATTPIRYDQASGTLTIGPTEYPLLEKRTYTVRVVSAHVDAKGFECTQDGHCTLIKLGTQNTGERVTVSFGSGPQLSKIHPLPIIFERLTNAQMELLTKDAIWDAVKEVERDGALRVMSKLKAIGAGDEMVSAVQEVLLARL